MAFASAPTTAASGLVVSRLFWRSVGCSPMRRAHRRGKIRIVRQGMQRFRRLLVGGFSLVIPGFCSVRLYWVDEEDDGCLLRQFLLKFIVPLRSGVHRSEDCR